MRQSVAVVVTTLLLSVPVYANPVLGNIASGNVSVQQTPNTTVINQSSKQAIINWQSFNIGKQEATHFQQPAGGIALNRISATQGASQIYGVLSATGKIILINPAGIFFGPSAYVNVGGLIATTANISDQNFLNGNYQFTKVPGYSGSVINEGQIVAAEHGLVALVAPGVVNHGMIQANLGHVVLASGEAFTLNFSGDNLVNFSINAKTSSRGLDQNGQPLANGVSNTGSIFADGGKILVTAQAVQGVLDNVINMQGIAQARSVDQQNGEIILSGEASSGVVRVAGKLDATGKGTAQKGGNVSITGYNLLLDSPTVIDVSGDAGGGNIMIGGNAHGEGLLPHANATVMMPGANVFADAITHGNGGNIVLWSDEVTKAYGHLSARGGQLDGNGGFIETSSQRSLDVAGIKIDTLAPAGSLGTWLLDPRNVTITSSATSGGAFGGGNPDVFTPVADDANVLNTDIQTNLASANVTITTGATGAQAGNITVSAPITWLSSNTLLLNAAGNIIINAGITGANGTLQLQAGALANTITTNASGTINVANFNLLRGTWSQISNPLPAFTVSNNFQINSGILPNANAAFIRALSGTGSSGSPYLLADIYGVQGIGSTTTTLGNSFSLNNSIDAAVTANWNSGKGFIPIGTPASPYTGNVNGQQFVIDNLFINDSTNDYVGLIGYYSNASGLIQKIGLTNVAVTGGANTGALIGLFDLGSVTAAYSTGTLSNTNPNVLSNFGVGGLIGDALSGTAISQSYSGADVTSSDGFTAGGLVGALGSIISGGTITDSYAYGNVTGIPGGNIGGLVGSLAGTVSNSYSTGLVTRNTSGGGLIGSQFSGGSVSNSYWDVTTSGQATSAGAAVGKTTTQLMTASTFAGWDITSTPSTTATAPGNAWFIFDGATRPILLMEWNTTINNAHELQLTGSTLDASYTLARNLDMAAPLADARDIWGAASSGFSPIGSTSSFTGTFDGGGFAISNLIINLAQDNVGLFSQNAGTIQNLKMLAVSIQTSGSTAGGVAGNNMDGGIINNVYTTGTVSAGERAGGIAGANSGGTVNNSTNAATVSASFDVGGIVGDSFTGGSQGTVNNSYNSGSVSGNSTVGGVVGNNASGAVINSYNTGSVSGSDSVGGLVGSNNSSGSITNSFSTGLVSGTTNTGGLVGANSATVTKSFWDTQTSGISSPGAGTGLTTSQMMVQSTFTGWDFSSVWGIIEGQSYPYLRVFYPTAPRAISTTSPASGGASGVLAVNGSVFDSTTSGAHGFLYFLEGNNAITGIDNTIADNSALLLYLDNGATVGNAIALAPTGGGSVSGSTGLTITANTIAAGNSSASNLSNTTLATALGALSDSDILYSAAGNNLTLGNATHTTANLTTTAATTFTVNGTIAPTAGGSGNATFNGLTTISGGSVTTAGDQLYNNTVTLGATTTLTGNVITFTNGINGNNDLNLNGSLLSLTGSLALNNIAVTGNGINNAFSLDTAAAQNWIINAANGGSLSGVSGVLGTFTFSNIQNLTGGSGNDAFTLSGGTLTGSVNGGTGSNTLTADNVTNTWNLAATDTGTVTGLSGGYNNIQNLTGGTGDDTFLFADNALVTGTVNGGSSTGNDTLSYLAYTTPISVTLTPGIFQGQTFNNASTAITTYLNINNLIGNGTNSNLLSLPNKTNTLVITGPQQGFINDPLNFSGFNTFISTSGTDTVLFSTPATVNPATNSALVGGSPLFFTNFNLNSGSTSVTAASSSVFLTSADVSPIIQQPDANNNSSNANGNWSGSDINQNINDLIASAISNYDDYLNQIKINPYCYQAAQ